MDYDFDENQVNLKGNLTKDANVRQTSTHTVVSFTVATKRFWKDKNGDRKEKSTYHNVVTSARDFVDIAGSLKKGDRVRIENGQIETKEWVKDDGSKAYMTEIVVPPFGKIENLGSQRKAAQVADEDDGVPF